MTSSPYGYNHSMKLALIATAVLLLLIAAGALRTSPEESRTARCLQDHAAYIESLPPEAQDDVTPPFKYCHQHRETNIADR